jgi:hypothetical protein
VTPLPFADFPVAAPGYRWRETWRLRARRVRLAGRELRVLVGHAICEGFICEGVVNSVPIFAQGHTVFVPVVTAAGGEVLLVGEIILGRVITGPVVGVRR